MQNNSGKQLLRKAFRQLVGSRNGGSARVKYSIDIQSWIYIRLYHEVTSNQMESKHCTVLWLLKPIYQLLGQLQEP